MAMLKTLYRKQGGCAAIQKYIEKEGECLAYDYGPSVSEDENWADMFDRTRRLWGKDKGRKYYHIIISPDPDDECDLATLRDLATSWMRERYPETDYVIGYHNDGGRIHAHIAMNSVVPDTGYKIKISDRDVTEDAKTLQRLCKERGLSYFENPRPNRGKSGYEISKGERRRPHVVLSEAEKRLLARGIKPWKQDVRDAIDASVQEAANWDDFVNAMGARGFSVKVGKRNVATFACIDAEGRRRTVRGTVDNLGSAYTLQGIMLRLPKKDGREYTGVYTPPVCRPIVVPKTIEEAISLKGKRRPWVDPQRMIDLIAIMRKNGFANAGDLAKAMNDEREFLDRQRMRLSEADAYAKFLEDAEKRIARWIEIDSGEDAGTLIASVDNLFERQSLEQWFAERGIDPYGFAKDADGMRRDAREEAARIAQVCDDHEKALSALASAMQTAQRIGMPIPETDAARAARSKGSRLWRGIRRIASREDLARLRERQIERTARRFEESGNERLKALAALQREASLQEQIEETRARIASEERRAREQDVPSQLQTAPAQGEKHESNNVLPQR